MKNKNLSVLCLLLAGPLAVFASSDTDRKIEAAATGSYNYRTVLENQVTVKAADGVVTLTGTADNLAQKELTGVYVREIDFVKSVKNDIMVADQPPKGETVGETIDDASITTQVKYALLTHKATSALKTKVTTTVV